MADPAALQEAIQRARQLAAKISHKRPASEMLSDSTREIGTVKVTHAYEKPIEPRPPRDSSRDSHHRDQREPQRLLDNNNQRGDSYRESARDGGGQNRESRGEHRDNRDGRDNHDSRDNRSDRDRDSREPPSREHRESSNNDRDDSMQRDSGGPPPGINMGGAANAGSGGGGAGGGNYSRGSSDEKIDIIIPHAVIGLVIGKGGENIKRIQNETGATVRVDPNTVDEKGNKVCTITGTRKAVEEAHDQVANVIENASTNKRPRMAVEGTDQYRMKIPASRTGAIIGKGGETIKSIKQQSGCDIELDKGSKDCGPEESVFIIRGTQDRISKARALIEARLASRGRDGNDQGGGPRSGGPSSYKSGVATGANAAPVAAYTDLPTTYQAAPQQASTDVSAAWAAYFAQYSSLYSQGGNQAAAATPGMPFAEQAMMGSTGNPQTDQMLQQQQQQQQQAQQPPSQQAQQQQSALAAQGGAQPDFSDQWIEYYLINGRPDFAQQIVEMKKQQQQQTQKPTS